MEKKKGYSESFKLCISKEKPAQEEKFGKSEVGKSEKNEWKGQERAAFWGEEIALGRKWLKIRKGD